MFELRIPVAGLNAGPSAKYRCPKGAPILSRINDLLQQTPGFHNKRLECSASAGLLKEFALPPSIFASKVVRPFSILTEFMNKRPPPKSLRPRYKRKKSKSPSRR